MCVCAYYMFGVVVAKVPMWKSGQLCGVASFLPPLCGFGGFNSCSLACGKAPLLSQWSYCL